MSFKSPPEELRVKYLSLTKTEENHFEALYEVARDPLIWEQHPVSDRWERVVFHGFFQRALQNDLGCFTIVDSRTNNVIGSTRFYAHDPLNASVRLGYTFLARKYWGTGANQLIKTALLDYCFQCVESVYFDIGAFNLRSIKATEKLGAVFWRQAEEGKSVYVLSRAVFLVRRPLLVTI